MSRLLGMATWLSASPFVLCFVWFSGFGSGSLTPALTATLAVLPLKKRRKMGVKSATAMRKNVHLFV